MKAHFPNISVFPSSRRRDAIWRVKGALCACLTDVFLCLNILTISNTTNKPLLFPKVCSQPAQRSGEREVRRQKLFPNGAIWTLWKCLSYFQSGTSLSLVWNLRLQKQQHFMNLHEAPEQLRFIVSLWCVWNSSRKNQCEIISPPRVTDEAVVRWSHLARLLCRSVCDTCSLSRPSQLSGGAAAPDVSRKIRRKKLQNFNLQ